MCGMPPPVFAGGDIQFGLWLCYLGQQWPLEEHLAPQQSARCDVAVAVPMVARAIIIIKRSFLFPPLPIDGVAGIRLHLAHLRKRADANRGLEARRWNMWTLGSRG